MINTEETKRAGEGKERRMEIKSENKDLKESR